MDRVGGPGPGTARRPRLCRCAPSTKSTGEHRERRRQDARVVGSSATACFADLAGCVHCCGHRNRARGCGRGSADSVGLRPLSRRHERPQCGGSGFVAGACIRSRRGPRYGGRPRSLGRGDRGGPRGVGCHRGNSNGKRFRDHHRTRQPIPRDRRSGRDRGPSAVDRQRSGPQRERCTGVRSGCWGPTRDRNDHPGNSERVVPRWGLRSGRAGGQPGHRRCRARSLQPLPAGWSTDRLRRTVVLCPNGRFSGVHRLLLHAYRSRHVRSGGLHDSC